MSSPWWHYGSDDWHQCHFLPGGDHRSVESWPTLPDHCIHGFHWARLFAAHRGLTDEADCDEELLFAAHVTHDLGTGPDAPGRLRFELEGADLAAVLTGLGAPAGDVDEVWEAIALHTTPQIPERMGPLTYPTYEGIWIDFGKNAGLVAGERGLIHAAYPRLEMVRRLTDAVLAHGARSETAAPPCAMAHHLAQERAAGGVTTMERGVIDGPWGEQAAGRRQRASPFPPARQGSRGQS